MESTNQRAMTAAEAAQMRATSEAEVITVQRKKVTGGFLLTGSVQWHDKDGNHVATQTDQAVAIDAAEGALRAVRYLNCQTFQYEAKHD